MPELINTIRIYLEAAYFIAGIILTAGIFIAFSQIKLLKKDIQLRSERSAKEKAIEVSSRYLERYVEVSKIEFDIRQKLSIGRYKGEIGDFSAASVKTRRIDPKNTELLSATLRCLNELEAIAAYCTSGVADEKTAFGIFGRSFCFAVESQYDNISTSRQETTEQPYWHNIVNLYKLWRPRLSTSDIQAQINALEQKKKGLSS